MKISINFDLPDDLELHEIEAFEESIKSEAVASIKRAYQYRGENTSEQVAGSMKVEKIDTHKKSQK